MPHTSTTAAGATYDLNRINCQPSLVLEVVDVPAVVASVPT
jgi:hypothetical protein